ncbi:type II 3-dehydroquinate dehydratase [Candidatus Blochmannia ocreatus (nom. nud.)]|uniref:3-dehydroquinate dehydratase n=1 Tax=Candidatus Blochmannia ocreatus (nom. nud.) TaxID=251538 RepID=A0ABY4SZU2_9ENTR|nr:type II 3-dehydroquinate dehydratase [Candidatus Blochmannia ocreatus]URJ25354.1 type II 3-dehydroquinate dehydratase [Candidatus Blochmannia ocreatus]
MVNMFRILLINGPNLNLLGIREPKIYGCRSLSDIVMELYDIAKSLGMYMDHFQSNAEHELVDRIHQSIDNTDFIIINPASFTHTSIALRDAFLAVNIPFVEIHLSNIYAREQFRQCSYLSDIALGIICGFGAHGYYCAIHMARSHLLQKINK